MKVVVGNKKLMDRCVKVHSISDNNMKDDESYQEEEDGDSSKQKRPTVNGSRGTRKKRTKNMIRFMRKSCRHYSIQHTQSPK
jgi:hypothetical protein